MSKSHNLRKQLSMTVPPTSNYGWEGVGQIKTVLLPIDQKTLCEASLNRKHSIHLGLMSNLITSKAVIPGGGIRQYFALPFQRVEFRWKEQFIPALLPCLCPKSHHHSPTPHSQSQLQHTILSAIEFQQWPYTDCSTYQQDVSRGCQQKQGQHRMH